MKQILLSIAAFVICINAYSHQKYTTFIVRGDVTVVINGVSHPARKGEALDENCYMIIPQGAYLTLKSSEEKRHTITINKAYQGTIKQMKKIHGAKVKRSSAFMDILKGKTSDDFVNENSRTMSSGGYNTRDIFISNEIKNALKELHHLFLESGLID